MIDAIQKRLLAEIADLHTVPTGAYNIRANSKLAARNTTANIDIVSKADVSGIDIRIKPGTKKESVHIPVVLSDSGLKETVYNDFYIGEDCDVVIVAGCGIHNCGVQDSEHDGVHRFFVGKNSKVKYVEKHYGEGDGRGKRILNPVTEAKASLVVRERLMTHGNQKAKSIYETYLNGDGAAADVVSRSVAREESFQEFSSRITGNAACKGHTECDAIIMDKARVLAIPQLDANNVDAALVHEAAIMTLGLTQEQAEEQIINGFLK